MLANILSISLGAILINNFIFSQFLGCCPFLGCSNKVDTAAGMGLAVVFVMGLASAICWVIDNYILIPLIVVNCIIIGRAEAFCQKNTVKDSFFDGIFQGLGYTCVLIIMCVFREFVGSGRFGGGLIDIANGFRFTLDGTGGGIQIFPEEFGASIMNLPFGGFLTLGLLIGLMQYALKKSEKKKKAAEHAAKEAALKEVEE